MSSGSSINTTGVGLMLFSIVIFALVGMAITNLNNSGVSAFVPASSCATYICPINTATNVVCVTQTQCQVNAFSFLNPNSPFTCIFAVNYQCFLNSLSSVNPNQVLPFQLWQTTNPIFMNCTNIVNAPTHNSTIGVSKIGIACFQTYQNNTQIASSISNLPKAPLYYANCTDSVGIITYGLYEYWFCNNNNGANTPYSPAYVNTTKAWFYIIAQSYSSFNNWVQCTGYEPSPTTGCNFIAQGFIITNPAGVNFTSASSNVGDNPNACIVMYAHNENSSLSPDCISWLNSVAQTNQQASGGQGFANLGIVGGLVAGLILLLIGLGIGISGGVLTFNFSMTPNSQGTRFCQLLGIALLIWSPLYSEFGSWIFNNQLSLGIGGLISITMLGLFFLGLWRTMEGTSHD